MTKLRDKVGVNTHYGYVAYSSSRIANIKAMLTDMGIRQIRDNGAGAAAVFGSGFSTLFVLDTGTISTAKSRVDQALAGGATAIELRNEPDINGGIAAAKTFNATMATYIRSKDATIPILNSAMAQPTLSNAQALGTFPEITTGAIHPYRANRTDSVWKSQRAKFTAMLAYTAPGKPYRVTECGYHDWSSSTETVGDGSGGTKVINVTHTYTPDATAAQQIIPDLQAFWDEDCELVYIYEAINQNGDGSLKSQNHEGFFGLGTYTYALKQQAVQLKNWLTLHGDEDDGAAPPEGGEGGTGGTSGTAYKLRSTTLKHRTGGVTSSIASAAVRQNGTKQAVYP